jgi:hypothetical protein
MDFARGASRARWAALAAALLGVSCLYDYEGALGDATSAGAGGGATQSATTTGAPAASTGGGDGATGTSGGGVGDGGAGAAPTSGASVASSGEASSSAESTAATTDAASSSTGPAPCPGDDFRLPTSDRCYRELTPRTWDQARTQCQDVGMHLATLDAAENEALVAAGQIAEATWIGGRREGNTTSFYWVVQAEGFPFNPPWNAPGEAADTQGDDCVTFLVDGTWGLRDCGNVVPALCETF